MSIFTVVNSIALCEQKLWEALSLAFQIRLPEQPDLAALRTAFVNPYPLALVYVASEDRNFRWSRESVLPDDGVNVIAPAAAPPAGRWLRAEHGGTYGPNWRAPLHSRRTGFCKAVEIYQGQDDRDEQLGRIFGQRPAILLKWIGDKPKPQSLNRGAHYRVRHDFIITCVSECKRRAPAAVMGSPVDSERVKDPGLYEMFGLVRYVLAGLQFGVTDEVLVEFGDTNIFIEENAERLFLGTLQAYVVLGFRIPDEDLDPMDIEVQRKRADLGMEASAFDGQNYVAMGYEVPPGPGLSRTFAAGIATIGGVAVSSTPPPATFAASSDTYRDLQPDGTLVLTAVDVDADPPDVPTGALRIGRTRSSATDIIDDRWLCSSSALLGAPMTIP